MKKRKWDAIINIPPEDPVQIIEQRNTLGYVPPFERPEAGMVVIDMKQIIVPEGYRMFVDQVCVPHYSGGELVSTTTVSGNSEDKEIFIVCVGPTGTRINAFSSVYVKVRFRKILPQN